MVEVNRALINTVMSCSGFPCDALTNPIGFRKGGSPTILFGKFFGPSDDYSLPSTPSQSSSPPPSPSSPAPFRSLPMAGNVRGLSSTPPLAQPELQYYLSSPSERELYNQLRTHTKARYLKFRNQVSELVSPSKLRQSPPRSAPPPSSRERSEEKETDNPLGILGM
jgi:hypothetical protein